MTVSTPGTIVEVIEEGTIVEVATVFQPSAGGAGGGDHPDGDHSGLTTVIAGLAAEVSNRGAADNAHAVAADPHPGYLTPTEANAAYDAAGAAAAVQAFAIQRGNHTGSQAQSTVTGLVSDLAAKADLVGGKVPDSQMGSLTISEHLGVVASQAAMLALVGQRGDWATRSDLSADFMVIAEPSSVLGNWRQFTTPASPVTSVNGRVGAVTGLAEQTDLTAEINRATAAELLKAPLVDAPLTGNPTAPTQAAGNSTTRLATTAFVQTAAGAKVADAITDGVADVAPSQNAVFDALAGKASSTVDAAAGVGSLRTLGTGATQAMPGNTVISATNAANRVAKRLLFR